MQYIDFIDFFSFSKKHGLMEVVMDDKEEKIAYAQIASTQKIAYLGMIQGVINRMANNSFMLKGWCMALLVALFALKQDELKPVFLCVPMIVVVMCWVLDAYFLRQERLFRNLYNEVVKGAVEKKQLLKFQGDVEKKQLLMFQIMPRGEAPSIVDTMFAGNVLGKNRGEATLLYFYGGLVFVLLLILLLKCLGYI